MADVSKATHIGLRRAITLANMSLDKQLDVIAEGFPILMRSASNLFDASKELSAHPRSAAILGRHACEEVAKILILFDLVRCPYGQRSKKIGVMMKWFYDHLARLIFTEAQQWKPMNARQLQDYIDNHRKKHYLEGEFGEYIVPNFELYRRESDMYADIEGHEDGTIEWVDPQSKYRDPVFNDLIIGKYIDPSAWRICKSLNNFGAFTRTGLDIVSETWSKVNFSDAESFQNAKDISYEMLLGFEKSNLISDAATDVQLSALYNDWQIPMYNMDFSPIAVSLEDLKDERDRNFASEMGYY